MGIRFEENKTNGGKGCKAVSPNPATFFCFLKSPLAIYLYKYKSVYTKLYGLFFQIAEARLLSGFVYNVVTKPPKDKWFIPLSCFGNEVDKRKKLQVKSKEKRFFKVFEKSFKNVCDDT